MGGGTSESSESSEQLSNENRFRGLALLGGGTSESSESSEQVSNENRFRGLALFREAEAERRWFATSSRIERPAPAPLMLSRAQYASILLAALAQ